MGLGFQILVLIVQNSFPVSQVGTATGAHSFFRQIGASLGSAAIGTLFTGRLMELLPEGWPPAGIAPAGAVDPHSLTPALIAQMPEQVKTIVVSSYNDALAPVYLYIVPLMVVGFVLLLFVKEKPLALTNEAGARGGRRTSRRQGSRRSCPRRIEGRLPAEQGHVARGVPRVGHRPVGGQPCRPGSPGRAAPARASGPPCAARTLPCRSRRARSAPPGCGAARTLPGTPGPPGHAWPAWPGV